MATTPITLSASSATSGVALKLPNNKYCIRYEGNSSKRWDGKEILLDAEWMEGLYSESELVAGKKLSLPWQGKGGRVTYWRAVLVPPTPTPTTSRCICSVQSGNLCNLEIALRIFGIPRLRRQSRDCITHVRNLETA